MLMSKSKYHFFRTVTLSKKIEASSIVETILVYAAFNSAAAIEQNLKWFLDSPQQWLRTLKTNLGVLIQALNVLPKLSLRLQFPHRLQSKQRSRKCWSTISSSCTSFLGSLHLNNHIIVRTWTPQWTVRFSLFQQCEYSDWGQKFLSSTSFKTFNQLQVNVLTLDSIVALVVGSHRQSPLLLGFHELKSNVVVSFMAAISVLQLKLYSCIEVVIKSKKQQSEELNRCL